MQFTPDGNDIIYDSYGIDLIGMIVSLFEALLGSDATWLGDLLERIWNVYSVIALILSLLFFLGFVYAKVRSHELSEKEQELIKNEEAAWAERYGGGTKSTHSRWSEIEGHIHDDNPNSWKIAIIEADIFLEEVLTDHGYVGVTIGDKLKTANATSFTTIQDAWEAHKVRNEIAHNSGDFVLTKRLAQETLMRYERVFREFGAI